jgi:hypothetical protein
MRDHPFPIGRKEPNPRLFPRVGFIVTNLETDSRAVARRGTAEQWIKESQQAVKMTRLSCHRFRSNEVRLWLSLVAYNECVRPTVIADRWLPDLLDIPGQKNISNAGVADACLPGQVTTCDLRFNSRSSRFADLDSLPCDPDGLHGEAPWSRPPLVCAVLSRRFARAGTTARPNTGQ